MPPSDGGSDDGEEDPLEDDDERCRTTGARTDAAGARRRPRASSQDIRLRYLSIESLIRGLTPAHECHNKFEPPGSGKARACYCGLYGDGTVNEQITILKTARDAFLSKSSYGKRQDIVSCMRMEAEAGGQQSGDAEVQFVVRGRLVCKKVLLAHYPVDKKTLNTLINKFKHDASTAAAPNDRRAAIESSKRAMTIVWFKTYAEAVGEQLPDSLEIQIPRIALSDMYKEYKAQMLEWNHPWVHINTFSEIFRTAPELASIAIASGKKNFGRCGICAELEAERLAALKAHDPEALRVAKQKQLQHIALERADRLEYWRMRDHACVPRMATSDGCPPSSLSAFPPHARIRMLPSTGVKRAWSPPSASTRWIRPKTCAPTSRRVGPRSECRGSNPPGPRLVRRFSNPHGPCQDTARRAARSVWKSGRTHAQYSISWASSSTASQTADTFTPRPST